VVCQVWNRMIDPGTEACTRRTTSPCSSTPVTLRWSYEEDIYNPTHFKDMVVGWLETSFRTVC